MARFPSQAFRDALSGSGQLIAVVELVKDGEVLASSATGELVVDDGTVNFDLTRAINGDVTLSLLIPGGP